MTYCFVFKESKIFKDPLISFREEDCKNLTVKSAGVLCEITNPYGRQNDPGPDIGRVDLAPPLRPEVANGGGVLCLSLSLSRREWLHGDH